MLGQLQGQVRRQGQQAAPACAGKCDGKCSGNVKGDLQGQVRRQLQHEAAASCSGTCSGSLLGQDAGAEVHGHRQAAEDERGLQGQVRREGPGATPSARRRTSSLRIAGAADAAAAAKFQAAIEKNLPVVLDVSIGMAKNVREIAAAT